MRGRTNTDQISVEELRPLVQEFIDKRDARLNLPVDLEVEDIHISTQERKWYSSRTLFDSEKRENAPETRLNLFSFDDIEKIWAESDSISTTDIETKNNGVGRAIVGGVLAGSTGAIVGAVTAKPKVSERTETKSFYRLYMNLKPYPGRKWQFIINSKQDLDKVLQVLDNSEPAPMPQENEAPTSPATELRTYKALLDEGIITQEDFEAKKKQLLGL